MSEVSNNQYNNPHDNKRIKKPYLPPLVDVFSSKIEKGYFFSGIGGGAENSGNENNNYGSTSRNRDNHEQTSQCGYFGE